MAASAEALTPTPRVCIQGDVVVAAGVAIAPNVFLSAAPGCRLVIAPGVCLGSDVILQANHGDLVIELGVNLGSGVLVVGCGAIGQHTCVGANSTVINPALGPSQVVAPGSVVGAPSSADSAPASSTAGAQPSPAPTFSSLPDPWAAMAGSPAEQNGASRPAASVAQGNAQNGNAQNGNAQNGNAQNGSASGHGQVYGKAQVNRMLASLFPHRQPLNGSGPSGAGATGSGSTAAP